MIIAAGRNRARRGTSDRRATLGMRTSSTDISQPSHPFLRRKRSDPTNSATPMPHYRVLRLDDRMARLGLGKKPFDEPSFRPLSPASWIVKQFRAVAGLLATLCLIPAIFRYLASQQRPAILPIPTKAKPGDPCGSDSRSDVIGR